MPLVQIRGMEGYLNDEQKKEMIQKVTDAVVSVEGEGLRSVTWVLYEDVPAGHWGVGGEFPDADLLRKMAGKE